MPKRKMKEEDSKTDSSQLSENSVNEDNDSENSDSTYLNSLKIKERKIIIDAEKRMMKNARIECMIKMKFMNKQKKRIMHGKVTSNIENDINIITKLL